MWESLLPLQLEQIIAFLGFFAWCARREFFLALDDLLRGTAIVKTPMNYQVYLKIYKSANGKWFWGETVLLFMNLEITVRSGHLPC